MADDSRSDTWTRLKQRARETAADIARGMGSEPLARGIDRASDAYNRYRKQRKSKDRSSSSRSSGGR